MLLSHKIAIVAAGCFLLSSLGFCRAVTFPRMLFCAQVGILSCLPLVFNNGIPNFQDDFKFVSLLFGFVEAVLLLGFIILTRGNLRLHRTKEITPLKILRG